MTPLTQNIYAFQWSINKIIYAWTIKHDAKKTLQVLSTSKEK